MEYQIQWNPAIASSAKMMRVTTHSSFCSSETTTEDEQKMSLALKVSTDRLTLCVFIAYKTETFIYYLWTVQSMFFHLKHMKIGLYKTHLLMSTAISVGRDNDSCYILFECDGWKRERKEMFWSIGESLKAQSASLFPIILKAKKSRIRYLL